MAESLKNSEFVSLVAELLELNLRALDRTEKRVADHVGLVDDEPEATASATAKRQPPLAPAPRCGHNHNHNHHHRTRSNSRQPYLVTQARAAARSASAPRDATPPRQRQRQQAWSTAPSPSAPRQRRDNSLLSSSTPLRTASPAASADAAGGGGGGSAVRKGRRPSAAPAAASRRRQPSRQRSASRTAPTVRGGTQRICTDNGCLVTATAVETGTTPAERNTLYARVLDAVDVVLQLPPHEGLQAYHGTHRRTRQLLIYKEYLSLPVLSSCARKMSGLMKREALKRLLYGVLTALDHLHRRCDVAHGHVRCSSIFADAAATTTKLSVPLLEWAASAEGEWVGREGPYLPPEQLREGGLPTPTPEGDVWAVGCVAMELLTGLRAWQHLAQSREAVRRVLCSDRPLPLPKGVEGEAASFLTACFVLSPEERRASGARGLMEHSFFASVRPTIFARGDGGGCGGSPQPVSSPAPPSSFHDAVASSPAAAVGGTRDASCSPLHQSLLAQRVSGLPAPLDATACAAAAAGGGGPTTGVASTVGSPLVATRVHSHASTAVSGAPAVGGGFARGVASSPLTPGSGPGSAVLWKASSAPPSVRRAGTAPSTLRKAKTAGGGGGGGGGGLASVAAPKAAAPRAQQDAAALRELQEKAAETEARVRRVEDTMQLISQRQEVTNNMLCSIAGSMPGTPGPTLGHGSSMLSTGGGADATPVRPLLAAAAPVQQQAAYAPYSPPPAGPAYATSVPPQHPFSSAWSAYPELQPAGAPIVISK